MRDTKARPAFDQSRIDYSPYGFTCERWTPTLIVAAARSKRGASHALLSRMPDARFQPVVSVPLFIEYRAVLLRPENLLERPATQAEGFLDFLLSASHWQEVFFLWRPGLPDPDDDLIL